MAGFNANYHNTGTDKNYNLKFDGLHGSAAVPYIPDPLEGLFEIECGEIVTKELHAGVFKALYRTDDIRTNQRYYSWLGTFRIDEPATVFLYVRSAAFLTHVVVWRNATTRYYADPTQSTAVERVFELEITEETVGPFIVEVSSMEPYATGEFEVELVCEAGDYFPEGFVQAGSRAHPVIYLSPFIGYGPPLYANSPYTNVPYDFATGQGLFGYEWHYVSGDLHGLSISTSGILTGTPTKNPPFSTYPNSGHPLPCYGMASWNSEMYANDWFGYSRGHSASGSPPMAAYGSNSLSPSWPAYGIRVTYNLVALPENPNPIWAGQRIVTIPIIPSLVYVSGTVPAPLNTNATPINYSNSPAGESTSFWLGSGQLGFQSAQVSIKHNKTAWVAAATITFSKFGTNYVGVFRSGEVSSFGGTFNMLFAGMQSNTTADAMAWTDLSIIPPLAPGTDIGDGPVTSGGFALSVI